MWLVTKAQKAFLRSYCADAVGLSKAAINIRVEGPDQSEILWLDFWSAETYNGEADLTLNVYEGADFISAIDVSYKATEDFTVLNVRGGISDENF